MSRFPLQPIPRPIQALFEQNPLGAHASAAAATPSRALSHHEDQEYVTFSQPSSGPPTLGQLAALTAVPMGMLQSARKQGGKKGRRKNLSYARFFNVAAGRPYPTITSLEQQIRVTMQTNILSALVSPTTIGGSAFYAKSFSLVDFGGTSSFLAVFDQYRFEKLEVWIEPTTGTTSGMGYPILSTCVDLDDSNTPTTLNSIEDHQQALTGEGQAGRYHAWKPHMAVAAYSGAFTSYSNLPAGWIDSASTAVQHYGFKAGVLSNGSGFAYNLSVRATIAFRAPGIN